jgi:hypothetical protein
MSDLEKTAAVEANSINGSDTSQSSLEENSLTLTPFEYRKLIWKLDLHLLPPLFALWFCSLIDRVNIGNAKLQGLEADLQINPLSNQFNIALVVIFVGLITCEVPSNYLVKKVSPSIILCAETFLLGRPLRPLKYDAGLTKRQESSLLCKGLSQILLAWLLQDFSSVSAKLDLFQVGHLNIFTVYCRNQTV